ncbi:MAG: RNA-binding domain-containing protein [Candidatus Humimicrobiaceae bacterium]
MIKELINGGESKTVEFKEDFPQKNQISKTAYAFANRAGGYIVIGVNDRGGVKGLSNDLLDEYLDRISNIVHDSVYPMLIPELYTYKIDNKNVIVVQVYPGNMPPYYIKSDGKLKGTYVRVGKTNKQADSEMIQELERRRVNKTFDEDISREADEGSISNLIRILENALGKEVTKEKLENLNLLVAVGDVKYLSNAALIVLGEMDNCRIKCARFTGDSVLDFIDRKEYSGDLFNQLDSAIGFIKSHINIAGVISGSGLRRKDVLEIPEEVFREAVLNAIVHRDYSISGSDIKIAVYNSRIDVISPGGLPKSITVEEIYAGRSEIRNKIIARIFREAGIIEQWGSGIPRIREACEQKGLKTPEISENGMFVKLTIYRRIKETEMNGKSAQSTIKISKGSKIGEEKERVYQLIKENGNCTVNDISRLISISEASVQRRLESLQKENRIRRLGSKKSGEWKII